MAKTCFIISRIGGEGTPERGKADEKLEHFFKPVLNELGYTCLRADQEETPGSISRSIVERIINSEIVIADISDKNPNVFYEISIRNAVQKPLIIIRSSEQKPPFDIQDTRAIAVDMSQPKIWRPAMSKLKKQVESAETDSEKASESILSDFTFKIETGKIVDKESEVLLRVKDLQAQVKSVKKKIQQIDQQTQQPQLTPQIDYPSLGNLTIGGDMGTVVCKDCSVMFPLMRPYPSVTGGSAETIGTCSACQATNSYSDEDFLSE